MSYVEGSLEQIAARLSAIDARFDRRFDILDRKIDQRFKWTIGAVLGTWLTTILAIFFHH